uniref:ATP-dependent DNA helicase n=1 Tax=Syphacia muris TaxID=451379 RepID=A0A0N5AWY6_9BILA
MDRLNLSSSLAEIDCELNRLDDEIRALKCRRQRLRVEKERVSFERIFGIIEKQIALQNVAKNIDTSIWESDSFDWSAKCTRILKETFKLDEFRPLQRAVINSVLSKNDTVVIMSTGGGKSLCYQLPAVLSRGIVLVVSPLISLIEDQILQLKKLSIGAATLNQSTSKEEVLYTSATFLEFLIFKITVSFVEKALVDEHSELLLLYVTPEKLAKSRKLMNQLEKCAKMKRLKLIAIDEVHCCSQWGYDFRPDYKFLNILKRQFRDVPLLGLTATASAFVIEDVKDILNIPAATVFYSGFNRPNLFYEVRRKPAATEEVLNEIVSLIKGRFQDKSGIIYCFTRKECEDIATTLRKKGVKAAHYHAYMSSTDRTHTHEQWIRNELQVIVATVAFGMGIDKPDVRFVIHHSMAKSVENYYQESGRAGRDGQQSVCILYFRVADLFRQSTMVCTEKNGLTYLYGMLKYCLQNTVCRRSIFADMYSQEWDSSECKKKCDICARGEVAKTIDVTSIWRNMCAILAENQKKERRLTGAKLIDLAMQKDCQLQRELAEVTLANLLLLHYAEEDFHFTPYAIISYIRMTRRSAEYINDTSHSISIERWQQESEAQRMGPMVKRRRRSNPEVDQ